MRDHWIRRTAFSFFRFPRINPRTNYPQRVGNPNTVRMDSAIFENRPRRFGESSMVSQEIVAGSDMAVNGISPDVNRYYDINEEVQKRKKNCNACTLSKIV